MIKAMGQQLSFSGNGMIENDSSRDRPLRGNTGKGRNIIIALLFCPVLSCVLSSTDYRTHKISIRVAFLEQSPHSKGHFKEI